MVLAGNVAAAKTAAPLINKSRRVRSVMKLLLLSKMRNYPVFPPT